MRTSTVILPLFIVLIVATEATAATSATARPADDRCYELRVYTSPADKLADLDRRFRKYSRRVFAKHDMDQVGFWMPVANEEHQFYYILSYPSCEARDTSWERFFDDPEWQRVIEVTEASGTLVTDVKSTMLVAADISPTIGPWAVEHPRIFELRTYTAHPGKLDLLLTRFRDHTMRIFQKHGMTNVGYWLPVDNEANKLTYLLAFPSTFARNEAWQDFIADPEWQSAYQASIEDGQLVEKIESIILTPTDYSPIR